MRPVRFLHPIQAKSPFRKCVADFFQKSLRAAGHGCGRRPSFQARREFLLAKPRTEAALALAPLQFLQAVDRADHQKKDEGDDEEINCYGQKIAPDDNGALLPRFGEHRRCDRFGLGDEVIGEVETAGDGANDRHDCVANQRIDDRAECGANDHTDGELKRMAEGNNMCWTGRRRLL